MPSGIYDGRVVRRYQRDVVPSHKHLVVVLNDEAHREQRVEQLDLDSFGKLLEGLVVHFLLVEAEYAVDGRGHYGQQ